MILRFTTMGKTLYFSDEPLTAKLRAEISPLLDKHWTELGHLTKTGIAPNFEAYKQLHGTGCAKIFCARLGDGTLVGYNVFFLRDSLHHMGVLHASQDLVFLHPDYRGLGFGRWFFEWCDKELEAYGCKVILQAVKAQKNYGPLLESMGYALTDLVYAREI